LDTHKRQLYPDEEYGLWLLLMRTYRALAKTRERELLRFGISVETGAILLTVFRQGELATPANIARELILEPHSVSQQLTRMEEKGLITKVKDLERKNQVRIQLTEEGYRNYLRSIRRSLTGNVMSVLSPGEQRLMWELLSRLRERALRKLGMEKTTVYPPSDPRELRTGFPAEESKPRKIRKKPLSAMSTAVSRS